MNNSDKLLCAISITKKFPGIIANENVNLEINPGEIHVIMGENGAGKTTLMNILAGIYLPDEGELYWKGKRINVRTPKDAIDIGIGMLHQHFCLIPSFDVTENIAIGLEKPRVRIQKNLVSKRIQELSDKFRLAVDANAKIWQLSVGEKQRVEIIKLLYNNAELLILDEPTAVLTPQEVDFLWAVLKKIVDEGVSIIIITHKVKETMAIADRISVMRKGKMIATVNSIDTTEKDLAKMMVGQVLENNFNDTPPEKYEKALEIRELTVLSDRDSVAINKLSLDIHKSEIVGIAGVAGNGQHELAEAITGLRKIISGYISINGKSITRMSPKKVIDAEVAYIPEDRLGTGLCPGLDIFDNIILKCYSKKSFSKKVFINYRYVQHHTENLIEKFRIVIGDTKQSISCLSGGNLQKVVLAREICGNPSVIIAQQPTRGLDISSTDFVHNVLLSQKSLGAGILLISEDLDELYKLADSIAVIYKGEIIGCDLKRNLSIDQIGLMMTGHSY